MNKPLDRYSVVLWDFDGVILDSMHIRDLGFEKVLAGYPQEEVDALLRYHRTNGGLSRYVKFRYFYENVRKERVTDEKVQELAGRFSEIMLELLCDEQYLIEDSLSFIRTTGQEQHIVSGSDQEELRIICRKLEIADLFRSINGSPVPKTDLVQKLIRDRPGIEFALVGDSINDYEAARGNGIDFFGYNNPALKNLPGEYIESFRSAR